MSSLTIDSTSVSLSPLNGEAYELNIQFLNGQKSMVSQKKFIFIQDKKPEKGSVWDVFTKNGICKTASLIDSLFNDKEWKEALSESCNAALLLSSMPVNGPLLAVLDMKESHTKYLPCTLCDNTVQKCEDLVCQFLQPKSAPDDLSITARKVHAVFHSTLPLDFVLLEGSLKMDLLAKGGFAQSEIDYLQSSKSGSRNFCQFTEFFMNAFKLGQSCKAENGGYFAGDGYFKNISGKWAVYPSYQLNTTLYPPQYKDMYAVSGNYANALMPIYSVQGQYDDKTGISTLEVGRKA